MKSIWRDNCINNLLDVNNIEEFNIHIKKKVFTIDNSNFHNVSILYKLQNDI